MKTNSYFQKLISEFTRRQRYLEDLIKNGQENKLNWLDTTDVCRQLNISKRTLAHFRESGQLPYSKIGGKVFYRLNDIDNYLAANMKRKGDKS